MKIIVDHREMRSKVIESLEKMGADIEITTLKVGDYVVSNRVAFERKRIDDLFTTLLERRELFSQLKDLAKSYRLPILIILLIKYEIVGCWETSNEVKRISVTVNHNSELKQYIISWHNYHHELKPQNFQIVKYPASHC